MKLKLFLQKTQKTSKTWLSILSIFCAFICSESVFGYQSSKKHYVTSPISDENFEKYKYLFHSISKTIAKNEVFINEKESYYVLRIVRDDLCEQDFCLTFVVDRCNRSICPSTTAMVTDYFDEYWTHSIRLGIVIRFSIRAENYYTTIMINDRYVAAAQGI